jgi:hypothetical protein
MQEASSKRESGRSGSTPARSGSSRGQDQGRSRSSRGQGRGGPDRPARSGSGAVPARQGGRGRQVAPRTSSFARQSAGEAQKPSFYGFLGDVVSNEEKTRRLGYLIRQTGFALAVILISLAAIGYIWMYKSPMLMKVYVGSGSTLFIAVGTAVVRFKRAMRRERGS